MLFLIIIATLYTVSFSKNILEGSDEYAFIISSVFNDKTRCSVISF